MANWTGRLDFVQERKDAEAGNVTPAEHCKRIAEKLSVSHYTQEWEVIEAIARLKAMAEDPATTLDDFDEALESLHNWADDRRIYLATF